MRRRATAAAVAGPTVRVRWARLGALFPAVVMASSFVFRRGAFGEPVGAGGVFCAGVLLVPFLCVGVPIALALDRRDVERAAAWSEGVLLAGVSCAITLVVVVGAWWGL